MNLAGQLLADAVAIVVLLGVAWRASSTLSLIRFEITALRKDVDRVVADKAHEHQQIEQRIDRGDERMLDHEKWHRGQNRR